MQVVKNSYFSIDKDQKKGLHETSCDPLSKSLELFPNDPDLDIRGHVLVQLHGDRIDP